MAALRGVPALPAALLVGGMKVFSGFWRSGSVSRDPLGCSECGSHHASCPSSTLAASKRHTPAARPCAAGGNAELLLNQLLKHTAVQTRCAPQAPRLLLAAQAASGSRRHAGCESKHTRGHQKASKRCPVAAARPRPPFPLFCCPHADSAPTWWPWWAPSPAPSPSRTSCSTSWTSGGPDTHKWRPPMLSDSLLPLKKTGREKYVRSS